jgi:hypothetical protein
LFAWALQIPMSIEARPLEQAPTAVEFEVASVKRTVFEVASIKPVREGALPTGTTSPDRFYVPNFTLRRLIEYAYAMPQFRILGGRAWMASEFVRRTISRSIWGRWLHAIDHHKRHRTLVASSFSPSCSSTAVKIDGTSSGRFAVGRPDPSAAKRNPTTSNPPSKPVRLMTKRVTA